MFLTVHSTAGLVIGQAIINPVWAFFIGIISHYILDIIPHGDEEKMDGLGIAGMAKAAIIDHIFVAINLLLLFYFKPDLILTTAITMAIVGAMLPDWLSAIFQLSERVKKLHWLARITKPMQIFHYFCHRQIIKRKYRSGFIVGMTTQVIILIIFWWII